MKTIHARRGILKAGGAAIAASGLSLATRSEAVAQAGGGTLRIGVQENFASLDPYKRIGRLDYNAVINLFDTLVTYGKDYVPQPMLAESWRQVDATTWRFALRKDVVFHDDTPFDANAAKYSIDKARAGQFGSQFRAIGEVVVVDGSTIEIRCTAPFPTILVQLAQQYASVVSPKAYEAAGDNFGRQPVGSGPFKLQSLEPSRQLVLVRNDRYWRKDAQGRAMPYLAGLNWRVLPDAETASLALQNNEIDFLYAVPLAFAGVLARNANLVVDEAPTVGWEYIMFNCSTAPFENRHLRRALQLAVDRQAIVETVSFGRARPALGPITPGSWAYDKGVEANGFYGPRANKDAAKRELAAGGMPNGFEFTLVHPTSSTFNAMAQALQAQLAEIGVKVSLQGKQIGAVLDDLFGSKFQALMIDWGGRIDEALVFPAFFGTGGGNNFGKYTNPEVDRVVTAAGEGADIAARSRLYQQAQKLITEDSAHVWLTVPSELKAYSRRVRGFVNFGDWRLRAETITLGS
jgi:peptide/nickel transport system substrate-binding protein